MNRVLGYVRPLRAYQQDGEHRVHATVLVQRQQAIRQLAPVIGPAIAFDGMRFYDRRDNSATMSLFGLGVVLVGVVIALWWTTGVQVDLSVLRGAAAFLNYRDLDRPTTRPGALSVAPSTMMAPELQPTAVAAPSKDSLPVPTAVVAAS